MIGFYAITALINAVTSSILGIFIYLKDREKLANRRFAIFMFVVAIWAWGHFGWQFASNADRAIFWTRAFMAASIFITITFFHFVLAFIQKIDSNKKLLTFGYLASSFFFLANFTSYFVKGVSKKLYFEFWPDPGILFHPFLILWVFYVLASVYFLLKEISSSSGNLRAQLQYIIIGTLIGFVGGGTGFILWYNIPIIPHGNFLVAVGIAIIAYAITKHQLFNIKLLLTEFLVGIFAIFLFAQIFISRTTFEYVWHIVLFIVFVFIGYLLIREVFKEIENKKDIVRLNEELNKALEKETGLKENFRQVAEERQNKIWDIFSRPEHIVNFELRGKIVKLAYTLEDAQKENKELKAKIKELEEKIEEKEK